VSPNTNLEKVGMRIGSQGFYWSPPGSTGIFAKAVFGDIFKEEGDLKDTVDLDVRSCITSNEGGWDEGTNSVSSATIKEDKRVEIREVNPTIIQASKRQIAKREWGNAATLAWL